MLFAKTFPPLDDPRFREANNVSKTLSIKVIKMSALTNLANSVAGGCTSNWIKCTPSVETMASYIHI